MYTTRLNLKILTTLILFTVYINVLANDELPQGCYQESWCLVNISRCAVTHYSRMPHGHLVGHSIFSHVKKITAQCKTGWGSSDEWRQMQFMTPVKTSNFRGEDFLDREDARKSAIDICNIYRNNWLEASIICQ